MNFEFNKNNWNTIEQGEKDCLLLTNGLGGYTGLTLIGSAARGDHSLYMTALKAPNVRANLVSNFFEQITIDGKCHVLFSQRMLDTEDYCGYQYLEGLEYGSDTSFIPKWSYRIGALSVQKSIVMLHGENTIAIRYRIDNPEKLRVTFEVIPLLRFSSKKEEFNENIAAEFTSEALEDINAVKCHARGYTMYVSTNAEYTRTTPGLFGKMYFSQDERDGRTKYSDAYTEHKYTYDASGSQSVTVDFVLSDKPYPCSASLYDDFAAKRREYMDMLSEKALVTSELGKQLALSVDAYVVDRESTNGKSIIAGYPFFEDWGRDTMISLAGATLVTARFDECRSILRTFAKYVKNGLLPNLFPEGGENPMYNSADAPLLFINSVYDYIEFSGDGEFLDEIFPVMEQIIDAYQKGTDFHIRMDGDGLISAGAGLEQLTWMDVRVDDFLPTPRHGKPVEINAYWYSALKIMEIFSRKLKNVQNPKYSEEYYETLAKKAKKSFLEKFWNEKAGCLKDVLSGTDEENQIRCNQIWALSMPFTIPDDESEWLIVNKVRQELFTTAGLRTLDKNDPNFHPVYIGSMQQRDRAYHQGTVWTFPLGAFYRANIRLIQKCDSKIESGNEDKYFNRESREKLFRQLTKDFNDLIPWLYEGCIGQLAEIYDGDTPAISRGCFAQAWSVSELLRAVYDYEML